MKRLNIMNSIHRFLGVAVLGLGLALSSFAASSQTIRMGVNNWPENVAAANMWKVLLEERGYRVRLIESSLEVIYAGVVNEALDLALEVWLPTTSKPFYEQHKDDFVLQGVWYRNTSIGLVVPDYVDIDSIDDLVDKGSDFDYQGKPTIFGIEEGSAIMRITETVIDDYGLDMRLMASSDAAMMASLDVAYQDREPIVVTLWNPHWAFSAYDLKYLDDPKNIYGDNEDIYWISSKTFAQEQPEIVEWMNAWELDDAQLGSLIAAVSNADGPEEGARAWIQENQALVDSWF